MHFRAESYVTLVYRARRRTCRELRFHMLCPYVTGPGSHRRDLYRKKVIVSALKLSNREQLASDFFWLLPMNKSMV